MSIRRKTLHAAYWSGSKNLIVQFISFAKVIVLARLMAPEEFGIYAVAILALAFIEAFSTTGVEDALVQHQGDIDMLIGTAWCIQIVRGVLLGALIWCLSAPIGFLMGSPESSPVIVLLAGIPLIRSLQNIELVRYVRNVRFHWDFLLSVVEVMVSFVVALLLVSRIGGAMALAVGLVLGGVARVIASHIIVRQRPAIGFNRAAATTLMSFGIWISLNRMAFAILLRLDSLLVAKLLGAEKMGIYQMGVRISDVGSKSIISSLSGVGFSSLSRLQDSPSRMRRAFLEGLELVAYGPFLLAAAVGATSADLVLVLLGPQWGQVAPVLGILIFASAVRAVASVAGMLFKALGRPSLDLKMSVIRALILVSAIWPLAARYDINGAAAAVMISSLALLPMVWVILNALHGSLGSQALMSLLKPLVMAALVFSALEALKLVDIAPLGRLTLSAVCALAVVALVSLAMRQLGMGGPLVMAGRFRANAHPNTEE